MTPLQDVFDAVAYLHNTKLLYIYTSSWHELVVFNCRVLQYGVDILWYRALLASVSAARAEIRTYTWQERIATIRSRDLPGQRTSQRDAFEEVIPSARSWRLLIYPAINQIRPLDDCLVILCIGHMCKQYSWFFPLSCSPCRVFHGLSFDQISSIIFPLSLNFCKRLEQPDTYHFRPQKHSRVLEFSFNLVDRQGPWSLRQITFH